MEEETFNTGSFNQYLLQLIQDHQKGPISDYNKGAVTALLEVSEEFHRLVDEMDSQEDPPAVGGTTNDPIEADND
ncbi:hypothetical protein [Enterococcus sp. AZ126]|uniref:hypothetical protein n=1 Tax=Enterococcus sp. AZ126 TaxID=2774635 RepID=UPI003F2140EB